MPVREWLAEMWGSGVHVCVARRDVLTLSEAGSSICKMGNLMD